MSNSIRNEDGIWINSQIFREDALHFKKYGYYTAEPWGSPNWFEFWEDRRNRIINGYESCGVKITGDHYFYLNFCPIQRTEDTTGKKSKKVTDFADFWDGDYNYFWAREIARDGIATALDKEEEFDEYCRLDGITDAQKLLKLKEYFESLQLDVKIEPNYLDGGYNIIVGKSRRKGYSFKNAAIGVKNFITRPGLHTVYGAYEKKYIIPTGIMGMAFKYLNFIDTNTAWAMPRDYVNKGDHKRASYKEYINGIETEQGFKSEMYMATFKDNPDAVRGKDIFDLVFEESGAFGSPGLLKSSYAASEDCVKDGEIKTGLITIFGTSGDMEGGTADYAEMFFNPNRFSLLPFVNIWEDEDSPLKDANVGFFHPVNWNLPGFYDEQGNSLKDQARSRMEDERQKLIDYGATALDIQQKLQEKPLSPSEAFAYVSTNRFPKEELEAQRNYLIANNYHKLKGQPVTLYRDPNTKKVMYEVDLSNRLEPITSLEHTGLSQQGCVVIYEQPVENAPKGLYKIGYDPVRQATGSSLAAIIVYKDVMQGEITKDCIVAEFIGRRSSNEENHLVAELLAELYGTKVMYENEVPDVKTYFQRRKLLHLLALQPDAVISKNIKNSKTNRVYGCHMNAQLKDAGESYVYDWLTNIVDYDENGKPITNIHRIYSLRLIEELMSYDRNGNFDLVSALFMCMMQIQEQILGKEFQQKKTTNNAQKLIDRYNKKKFGNRGL